MTHAPTVTVASRAHRAFRDIPRFRFATGKSPLSALGHFDVREHRDIIGVYENPHGVEPRVIVVTEQAIGCLGANQERWIPFDDISTTFGPKEKLVDDFITVLLKSGTQTKVRIAGGDDTSKDVYGFVRFIDRVIGDRSTTASR